MQACVDWVLITFGTQVINKKRPVRSVFPDYLSISYDYDVNEQVFIFNSTITDIMSNFFPNEIIICDDRDPPWINGRIKNLILYKANFYKTFVRGKNSMFHFLTFHTLQNHLNQFIQKAKQNNLTKADKNLSDPSTSTK